MSRPRSRSLQAKRPGRAMRAAAPLADTPVRDDARNTPGSRPIASLPAEVARQSQREMDRLRRLPSGSPEAAQVRSYLQWLWSMPWEQSVSEDADLNRVQAVLEREQLGLARAKERVLEFLAVRMLKPDLPGPSLCLVGPPGTGKSSLGEAIARALQRPFARISVSGTSDAADLIGVPRSVPGAQPGRIVRALREAGTRNPVLLFDGVDRLAGEGGLGVMEVLLELLDPESCAHFTDHFLGLPIDLSHAILLLCANHLELLPDPLQERLEVIEVHGYSEDEKIEIARRFLLPRQLASTASARATWRSATTRCARSSATGHSKPVCAGSRVSSRPCAARSRARGRAGTAAATRCPRRSSRATSERGSTSPRWPASRTTSASRWASRGPRRAARSSSSKRCACRAAGA